MKKAGKKLVIIDIYETWVAPCKFMASYMQSPKRWFAGQVVILQIEFNAANRALIKKKFDMESNGMVFLQNGKVVDKLIFYPDNPSTVERILFRLVKS